MMLVRLKVMFVTGVVSDINKVIAEYLKKNNLTELRNKINVSLLID